MLKNKIRKLLALVLAGVMITGMEIPVHAATVWTGGVHQQQHGVKMHLQMYGIRLEELVVLLWDIVLLRDVSMEMVIQ